MRTYQRKFLPDGSVNLAWKPDTRKGSRHKNRKKLLPDGSLNPAYRVYVAASRKKVLADGSMNPAYQPRHNKPGKHNKSDFIAIDGEGITLENGEHRYVLLVASTGEKRINLDGLSSQQCFDFLCDLAEQYPRGIFVCFGASYDINQMLRDLSPEDVQELWEARDRDPEHQSISWYAPDKHKYSLSYRPRKSFIVRRFHHPPFLKYLEASWKDQQGHPKKRTKKHLHTSVTAAEQAAWMQELQEKEQPKNGKITVLPKYQPHVTSCTLWDVWSFFQTSFVEALGGNNGYFRDLVEERVMNGVQQRILVFPDGLEINLTAMQQMKQQRRQFSAAHVEQDILPYCRDEVQALVRLMNRVRELLRETGLKLSRWDGAGAAAGALLQREGIKRHMQEARPTGLLQAQRSAYAGGRIELGQFGSYVGPVYNYDLHSAYPSAAIMLPSLTGGHWRKIAGPSTQDYSLSHIRWQFDSSLPYYPFFYRDAEGTIYFPPEGEGWYWKPEIDAALAAYHAGKLSTKRAVGIIEILESWEFLPTSDVKPFAFIQALYDQRARWKQAGNAAEKVLKLAINALYGKTTQSVGGTESQPPAYHNIGWAGYITSMTRAKLFTAIMQAPGKIIQIQTDGLYSLVPLNLPQSHQMGEWEEHRIDGIIAVQAGIYWGLTRLGREPTEAERTQDDFRERFLHWHGAWFRVNPHYRGFDTGSLTADDCLKAWEAWSKNRKKAANATYTVPATRFITLGSALANRELWPYWRTFRTIERELDLLPTGKSKRYYPFPGTAEPAKQLYQTQAFYPQWIGERRASAAYRPKWRDRQEMEKYVDGVPEEQVMMEVWESTL